MRRFNEQAWTELRRWCEGVFVPAGDELAARRRADWLNVVVFQFHALRGQFVQSGGLDGGVVVPDVIEALRQSRDCVRETAEASFTHWFLSNSCCIVFALWDSSVCSVWAGNCVTRLSEKLGQRPASLLSPSAVFKASESFQHPGACNNTEQTSFRGIFINADRSTINGRLTRGMNRCCACLNL